MPEHTVPASEVVSRYLIDGEMRKDGVIRHQAFMPSPRTMKHSVFRTSGLSEGEVWAIAMEKVEPSRGRVIGRGDLLASLIYDRQLQLLPDQDTGSRHADIVGWSTERELRATIAKELAALASPAKKRDS